jgi:4-amino-4-deoxy-L-arabinose transferase-like glycosyltransferase
LTLLRLPYFWDEGGYYIPAALDFLHTGTLIPQSTITNAHPPLPSILLAGWWHITGFTTLSTRTFVCLIAAAALLAVYRLARTFIGESAAAAVALLTAVYPIWYVQSTLAHADIFAAAFTLWALALYIPATLSSRPEPAHFTGAVERSRHFPAAQLVTIALLFTLSVLCKETAIVTPFALALHRLYLLFRDPKNRRTHVLHLASLSFCVLPLLAWYGYHAHRTGFMFGNPEFLRYNATANLDAHRIILSLYHRLLHLLAHMNMWTAALITAACLLLPRRFPRSVPQAALTSILIVLVANWFAFSILGGALLTRYLLPMYPLLLLLFVSVWRERTSRWPFLAALTAAAFLVALHVNPPYAFAPEDNLTYRDMIVLHQQAVAIVESKYSQSTVLTAWPANAELSRPDLGYTHTTIKVLTIQNFALDQLRKAAQSPGDFDVALLFSTKYEPPAGRTNLSQHMQNSDARYFDFHRDLMPAEAATLLHGQIIWQREHHGEWAAVLRFPRSYEANLLWVPTSDFPDQASMTSK